MRHVSALSLCTSTTPDSPVASPLDRERQIAQLGIAELTTRLHAATYQLLVLLREFDARAGWNNGFLSCAHPPSPKASADRRSFSEGGWLHWRTGIDLGAAREKVRVARALADLQRISAAMERGELSYARVRAISRIASADNEQQLLDVARVGTAAQSSGSFARGAASTASKPRSRRSDATSRGISRCGWTTMGCW